MFLGKKCDEGQLVLGDSEFPAKSHIQDISCSKYFKEIIFLNKVI